MCAKSQLWCRCRPVVWVAIFEVVLQAVAASAAPYGYTPNNGSGSCSVIDLANNSVVASIGVGGAPIRLAVTPDGKKLYVVNTGSDNITVIDTATRRATKTIAVGDEPAEILISPDGTQVYVPNAESRTVSVINTATDTVIATLNASSNCRHIIWVANTAGNWVYVANQGASSLTVIDPVRVAVDRSIGVGGGPRRLWAAPDGSRVYSADFQGNTVTVVDTITKKRIATIPVGEGPRGIVVTPDGTEIYAANLNGNSVSVISAATLSVISTINVGGEPWTVVVSPDGTRVYCVNSGNATVSVIDRSTKRVIATVPVGQGAFWAVFSADGSRLYVSNPPSDSISVINTANNSNLINIHTQLDPWVIAIQPDGTHTPAITGVDPDEVPAGSTTSMTVTGSGFLQGAKAHSFPLNSGVAISDVEVLSSTALTLKVTPGSTASGLANLTVINPQTLPAEEDDLFTITPRQNVPAPNILSVIPTSIAKNSTVTVTVAGSNFQSGATVTLQPSTGITVQSVQFVNSSTLLVTLSTTRNPGNDRRTVLVTNPDGKSDSLNSALRVQ